MSTRRGRRKSGRGRGKGKTRNKGRSQNSSELLDNLNHAQNKTENKTQNKTEIFVGLDVGSTSIKIAVVQSNANAKVSNLEQLSSLFLNEFHSKINLLADDSGERCIPSVITILDTNHNETLIGTEAVKSSIRNYKNCIYHSKHLVSLTQNIESQFNEWKKSASQFGIHKAIIKPLFDDEKETKLKYRSSNKEYLMDHAFVSMLKKVFHVISSQTGSNNINIVSSVPYYYEQAQIAHYESLLVLSGFNPLQIIYDHSASILALNFDNYYNESVLCIDFGTLCSTFCVIQMCNGLITSQRQSQTHNYYNKNVEMSGIALDKCILQWLIKDFENRNKGCYIEIENAKTRLKLLKEITRIKYVLSSGSNQVRVDIESLYEGIDYHFTLSKPKFESIIYDVINGIADWIHQQIAVIAQSKLSFDKVIASGGLSEIPKFQNTLRDMFGDKLMTKDLISKGIAPNFVNVFGCAVEAAALSYICQLQQESAKKIINITKPNKKNKNKNQNKNAFLDASANNEISFNAKRICLHYILGQKRKQFCCIEKNIPLPFESNYKIEENEIKMVLNDDVEFDITFTVDIVDDDGEDVSLEQSINNVSFKSKKKNKDLLLNIALDDNNDLTISFGKEKLLFEFDEVENDDDNDDDEDDHAANGNTLDID